MLRITQRSGFNTIATSGASAGVAPSNPDHAWRFYGAPASLADAVASADFSSFGSPATEGAGINNACLKFTSPAQYLTESSAIIAGAFTLTGFAKVSIGSATNAVFNPIYVETALGGNYMDIYVSWNSSTSSWDSFLSWNGLATQIAAGNVNDGQWFFFALSWDGSSDVIGQVNADVLTHADPMSADAGEIRVNATSGAFIGGTPEMLVDEICCFHSELTVSNKAWIRNGGTGRFVDGSGQF